MTSGARTSFCLVFALAALVLPAGRVPAYGFDDVPKWHWAWRYIEGVGDAEIAQGYEGEYWPDDEVDRAQMAVYICRSLDLVTGAYEGRFPDDVPDTQWAWPWIEALAKEGIVQGFDPTHYRPDDIVNRDAMAVYVARALEGGVMVPSGPAQGTFEDVPDYDPGPAHPCYDEIEYCVAHGVVQGYPDGLYHPGEPVTRAQMAVYISRAWDLPMPPQPYNITDYCSLAEGNTLSYQAIEWSGPFADTVSGSAVIDDEEWIRLERDNGRVQYVRRADEALYMKGADQPSIGEIRWNPPLAFPNGLDPGDSGVQTMHTTLNGEDWGTTTFTWLFVGPDAVSTHAGEFDDCMKFYLTLTLPGKSDPDDDGYDWFARGIGDVKQEMYGYWQELFSATVGGVRYPADGYWVSNYYPLNQGDIWNYNTSSGGTITQGVVGTVVLWGREYASKVNAAEKHVSYEQVTSAGYYFGGEFNDGHLTTFYPAFFTPNGMRPGDILQQTRSMYVDGELQGDLSVTGEFLGIEDVTVPAGFFPACLKLNMQPTGGGLTGKRWWWAEGVGRVKSDETIYGGPDIHELVWAVVGGVSYP